MTTIQLTIPDVSDEQAEILIAMLDEMGFSGFEQRESQLIGYVEEGSYQPEATQQILNEQQLSFTISRVESINWNAEIGRAHV